MALEHPREGHVGERLDRAEEPPGGAGDRDVLVDQLVAVLGGRAAPERAVEGQREAERGRGGPERVVGRVVVRQGRVAGDEAGPRALGGGALDLGDGGVDAVVDRDHRQPDDALRVRGLEVLQDPVVVGAHAGEPELAVGLHVGEDRAPRVDDAHVDAVEVHVGDVRGPVVVAGHDLVEAQPGDLVALGAAGERLDAQRALRRRAVEAPPVAAVGAAHHLRRAVAQGRRDTVEDGGRLVDVAVGRDDACHGALHSLQQVARVHIGK